MKAPEFSLKNTENQTVTLQELLKVGPTVFVFYPGAFTPVCTKQLCSYQDSWREFQNLGMQIVGISGNTPEKNRKFKEQHRFQFQLLSDPGKEITRSFGATTSWLLGAPTRANFIVVRQGTLVFSHVDSLPVTHQKVESLMEAVTRLKTAGKI
ncbi:MAG: peroxiredoxin [Methylotenera sp.]|nr:peroxiredoxin [Oligoflexia bacterium]